MSVCGTRCLVLWSPDEVCHAHVVISFTYSTADHLRTSRCVPNPLAGDGGVASQMQVPAKHFRCLDCECLRNGWFQEGAAARWGAGWARQFERPWWSGWFRTRWGQPFKAVSSVSAVFRFTRSRPRSPYVAVRGRAQVCRFRASSVGVRRIPPWQRCRWPRQHGPSIRPSHAA